MKIAINREQNYSQILTELKKEIPIKQYQTVMSQDYCELDNEFLGFLDIYKPLSELIPKEYTIIDFGCNLAAQCYLFANHKKYMGVDSDNLERFSTNNTTHYVKSIQSFIRDDFSQLPEDNLHYCAICSYVPDPEAVELVRKNFQNVFCFYPANFRNKNIKQD